jgi:hypothetical protein
MQYYKRVSTSFKDHELLDDDALSENYDEDAFYQDFDEKFRLLELPEEKKAEEVEEVKEIEDKNYGLNLGENLAVAPQLHQAHSPYD